MYMQIYKTTTYKHSFEDVEYTFDVRQRMDGKREYVKFEYQYEENMYRTLDSLIMRRWYPIWINRLIFKIAEKAFCRLVSREVGRKLMYKTNLKYK